MALRRVGPYELGKKLGRGGAGKVYMARRVDGAGFEKALAIKVLAEDAEEAERVMFRREAQLMALLNHSNIVQVFERGEHEGREYIVMQWVDGLDLAAIMAGIAPAGLSMVPRTAAYVVGEIARALAYLQAFTHRDVKIDLVHRDVAPQNVMVSAVGEVKLVDFGIARSNYEHTTGVIAKGTLNYMAPEQWNSQYDPKRTDLYPLGAILHELLTGEPLRKGSTRSDFHRQIVEATVPEIEGDAIAPELDALRRSLLAPEPEGRPESAQAVVDALEAWPGYSNASKNLAKICSYVGGFSGPRSGLYDAAPSDAPGLAATADGDAPATPVLRDVAQPNDTDRLPEQQRRETDRMVHGGAAVARRPVPAAAWVGSGVVLGALGFWVTVIRGGDAAQVDPPVASEPAAIEPATQVAAEPRAGANEAPTEARPTTVSTATTAAGDDEKPREAPAKPKQPITRGRVKVKLQLSGPTTVWTRFDGGKVHVLEPWGNVELVTGTRHRVEWKTEADAPWRRGKSFTLQPGRTYTLFYASDGPKLESKP